MIYGGMEMAASCVDSARTMRSPHEIVGDTALSILMQALGSAVLAGACITKVPQIRVILKNQSAAGLSGEGRLGTTHHQVSIIMRRSSYQITYPLCCH